MAFHQNFLFDSKGNCSSPKSNHMSLKTNKLLLKVCWQFLAKKSSSMKRETIPLHEITLHYVVWFDKFPRLYFIVSHVIELQFFSSRTQTKQFPVLILWNVHAWSNAKIFSCCLHLSASVFQLSCCIAMIWCPGVQLINPQSSLFLYCERMFHTNTK
jgi:hypothetical protein